MAGPQTGKQTPAPGAMVSPQRPGMTPDRPEIAGVAQVETPPATLKRRPLTQYGTAEAIMDVYGLRSGEPVTPEDFEQADASSEELRRANPALMTPVRPLAPPAQLEAAVEAGEPTPQLSSGPSGAPPAPSSGAPAGSREF